MVSKDIFNIIDYGWDYIKILHDCQGKYLIPYNEVELVIMCLCSFHLYLRIKMDTKQIPTLLTPQKIEVNVLILLMVISVKYPQ